jgi:hypothetical protein
MPEFLQNLLRDFRATLLSPQTLIDEELGRQPSVSVLFAQRVMPMAALRPLGTFLRSTVLGEPLVGLVLGLGDYALQIGLWFTLSLLLPALGRVLRIEVHEEQGFVIVTLASIPYWFLGSLFLMPTQPFVVFAWSRLMVMLASLYGFYLLKKGLGSLNLSTPSLWPLVGVSALAAFIIYAHLYLLVALGAHLVLLTLR